MAGTLDTLLRGAIVLAAFIGGNLVAGGILVLLGTQAIGLEEGPLKVLAMLTVMVLAVTCALVFVRGCMREIAEHLQYPPRGRAR